MKVEILERGEVIDFADYCRKHRFEVDDSFLYEEDLKNFEPDNENPTCVMRDKDGRLIAAASLIIDEYHKRGRKARFRIFHSEIDSLEVYKLLLNAILQHTKDVDKIFLFVPLMNKNLENFIQQLNFEIERYSYLLLREGLKAPQFNLPEGFTIKAFRSGVDEEAWCEVRNASFAKLKGSETPISKEMIAKMVSAEDFIEGGMLMLYHYDKPVGIVRGSKDEYDGVAVMNIGPLAILPEYQGRGLGRCLLRASLNLAEENSYDKTILCVNAENERAKNLYEKEGFRQVEAVACYKYDLR